MSKRQMSASGNVINKKRRPQRGGKEGVKNVMEKLEDRVAAGDYYGALQMYKTLFCRHKPNQPLKAMELAEKAAVVLIDSKQTNSAMEITLMLLELYQERKLPVDQQNKDRILTIHQAFLKNNATGSELANILNAAVKWSATCGSRKRGDPQFQLLLARAYADSNDFSSASRHYLHAEKPVEFANQLATWSKKGYASERDLFIARAVLQLLSLENLKDANIVFETFTKHFSNENIVIDTPLINFLSFLLQTLERDALPLFQLLQEKYAQSLARDNLFKTYLGHIGQKFYGLQPPQSGLSAIMNMFGGGF